jgi:maltooligosyltrehalose trehalohydrolase
LSGHQFVAYLQNHDQLGNRVKGERICELAGFANAKIGAALILLSPYIPMLFQGEEWGTKTPFLYFVDFEDEPDLAKAVADGRCREFSSFGWRPEEIPDPNSSSTFQNSQLKWEDLRFSENMDMLYWYKSLIALRRQIPVLTSGRLSDISTKTDAKRKTLCVLRDPIRIICNFSEEATDIGWHADDDRIVLASHVLCGIRDSVLRMPGQSVAILAPVNSIIVDGDVRPIAGSFNADNALRPEEHWSNWFMQPLGKPR